jgi:hypothetical protein
MEKTGFTADETATTGDRREQELASFTNPRAASIAGSGRSFGFFRRNAMDLNSSSSLTLSSEALRFNDQVEAKELHD